METRNSMKKRVFAIVSVWTMTLAWHLRFYRTRAGSPIPSTWGVNIDWTRFHVVKTGYIGSISSPFTKISSFAGAQNYDLGSLLMASLNIVTGTTSLVGGLTFLNAVSFCGLFLLPVVFIYWLSDVEYSPPTMWVVWLTLLFALFPAAVTILKTTEGWYTEPVATVIILMIVAFIPRLKHSHRLFAVVGVLTFLMMNLYHTWVFLFLIIVGMIYGAGTVIPNVASVTSRDLPTGPLNWRQLVIISLLFIFVGSYINTHFSELAINFFSIFANEYDKFYSAAGSPLIETSASDVLTNLNLRQVAKLFNILAILGLVALYAAPRIFTALKASNPSFWDDPRDRVLFSSLFAFPLIVAVFYSMGGLAMAVGRTRYIGVYFGIFCAIILLHSRRAAVRRTAALLIAVAVTTAVISAALSGLFQPWHTDEEQAAILMTGSVVSDSSYVFSDASLGPPLEYYEIRGIAILQVTHKRWEQRIRDIYYRQSPTQALRAIQATIQDSRVRGDAPRPDSFYVFMSRNPQRHGVPLLSFVTKPTGVDPRQKFNHNPKTVKIYSTGEVTLFRYEATNT